MIESIKKKLEQKCPKVSVSAMHISSLLYAIQEIILEDRLHTGHYTKEQLAQECFKLGVPQSHILGLADKPKPPKPPNDRKLTIQG